MNDSLPNVNSNNPAENRSDTQNNDVANQLEEKVEETIGEILDTDIAAPEKKRALVKMVVSMIKVHSGPLPDGDTIEQYSRCIPDGGNRVMALTERQQVHRHNMEDKHLTSVIKHTSTGQWMGFALAIAFLGVGTWLISAGHELAGILISSIDLVALVGVFVLGKYVQKSGNKTKD